MPFIAIFLIIPFIELALFASVSEHIGIWTTLLLAFLTAIIGGMLVKQQGLQTMLSMRKSMNNGEMPLNELFDGFCLVAAGALLITPGFLTDTIGFALLTPPFRAAIRHFIRNHTQWAINAHMTNESGTYQKKTYSDSTIIEGEVIDAEYEDIEPTDRNDKRL